MLSGESGRKLQILEAAQRLFAANGFHGTSVEEIAKSAKVNKATIYYYFPSKQAILDSLIEAFTAKLMDTVFVVIQAGDLGDLYKNVVIAPDGKASLPKGDISEQLLSMSGKWIETIINLFGENKDILRIMISESVKDGENSNLLFKLSDLISMPNPYQQKMDSLGVPRLTGETLAIKFLGGFLPLAHYAVCHEDWAAHYGDQEDTLKKGLLQLFNIELMGFVNAAADTVREDI